MERNRHLAHLRKVGQVLNRGIIYIIVDGLWHYIPKCLCMHMHV